MQLLDFFFKELKKKTIKRLTTKKKPSLVCNTVFSTASRLQNEVHNSHLIQQTKYQPPPGLTFEVHILE